MSSDSRLEDAHARIDSAKDDYRALEREMARFLYKYVEGMLQGFDHATGNFVVRLRKPSDSIVRGRPRVLTAQIVENVRSVFDYLVFELSLRNNPALNRRHLKFVITDDEATFRKEAKSSLKHLTDRETAFVEELQPYRGNGLLALIRDASNRSKHRKLLSVRDSSSLEVVFGELARQHEYQSWWVYPEDKGAATFARPKNLKVVLMERYDAMATVHSMIEHASEVVGAFDGYLAEGIFPAVFR